ncbi:5-oxoprolinase subunit B/C family protein [Nesterenkonia halotolerans]|uniref:KipI family sensor histidine kinase inhibitor n=1 Tax=Nesterenkonia halotolerans TaxID=225325 RepID=A0ABR9J953_9MICC|nr:carboxyltransferase domain-containing protein [Nesterenkonia halotolerans]MBE1515528.1 KipI family sensor histidine kinase inhibitor [Nesterenkonia halotolerans]
MISAIREAGPRALLLQLQSLDDVLACHQQLTSAPFRGQVDAVAAARTVLLRFSSRPALREARQHLDDLEFPAFSAEGARHVELEVIYDGEDLEELAAHLGMSTEALITWHSGQAWTGAFGGFAPGFTYCVPSHNDDDAAESADPAAAALDVPRRSSPRKAVPAGAVALAGEFSAVYPRVSPGGWQLIGHTPAVLWDLEREARGESPALVRPGDSVRYTPVQGRAATTTSTSDASSTSTVPSAPEAESPAQEAVLNVVDPGLQTLIQDLGRVGFSDLGVSRAGVADEASMLQANRLVGNEPHAAVLESLHGGLSVRAESTAVLAVCGAEVPLTVTGVAGARRPAPLRAPFALSAGETLSLGAPERGLRSVLALRGGIAATEVLGSVSTDTMSGLGPAPLAAGDHVSRAELDTRAVGMPEAASTAGATSLRFTYGPREDWFSSEEAHRLTTQSWTVTQASNRIGIRLEVGETSSGEPGRPLERLENGELPSEGVVRGSLQMPPAGAPVLFLNDHPVTGGYPVIGVVIEEDLPAAAQLVPGDTIHLTPVDPDTLTSEKRPHP